ncbi:MAG: tRNA (guanine(10)-N(2))-dimethyltransferase [Candidatus Aenigmatarchaeota archaeon]
MQLRKTAEGKISLWVPKQGVYEAPVFYNPAAALSRDVSVAALQVFQRSVGRRISVCDALAATGVRGIRYAKEVAGVREAVMVDKNPLAVRLIRKNIRGNKCGKCLAVKDDVNRYLYSGVVFDFIDIDPFGPPVNFLDAAARSVFHRGFVGVTATDTAPLCGAHPDACFRKYGIRPAKADYYAELGLRILLSNVMLAFAKHERAFVPALCFADQHYFRVFGRIGHEPEIRPLLDKFGPVNGVVGAVYLGKLKDYDFCKETLDEAKRRKFGQDVISLLSSVLLELDVPFYFDLHKLARREKLPGVPRMDAVISRLREKGFAVSRTHFCDNALKTDAPEEAVLEALRL